LLPDWLRRRAKKTPGRLALLGPGDEAWSYRELDARVDAAVAALRQRGVQPAERVGLHAPNSLAYVLAVHALMRLGATLVPLNTRLTQTEIEWQQHDAQLSHVLDAAAVDDLLNAPPAAPYARDYDLDAWHCIMYTSGTTGRPKGAILTYGNHWHSAQASAENMGAEPEDRWLACLPLFHIGGLAIVLRSVWYGTAAIIHERFDAERVNRAIEQDGVTIVSVVSTMLQRMLDQRAGRPYPKALRCVLLGGGPAPLPLLETALQLGAPVIQSYGLTEAASQVATLAPEERLRKVGSAGKPLKNMRLRIEPDGEILIDGPAVSPGYLHQPPRTGWLRTGDLGYLDADGYLYVLDRRDDLIVSGGENVYPAEVESALRAHPAVEDAGVRGLEHAEWGQTVAAFVQLRRGASASEADLTAFCRQRLAGYKIPRHFRFVEQLPRNAAGKLLRRELRF
jgi:o-succinylbenzoate---CoA ligase